MQAAVLSCINILGLAIFVSTRSLYFVNLIGFNCPLNAEQPNNTLYYIVIVRSNILLLENQFL